MSDYGGTIGSACPGALADSSTYNIDGACFVKWDNERISGPILCGQIVKVSGIFEGVYKEISSSFTNPDYDIAYGVALSNSIDTYVNDEGMRAYESASPISVVTHGRVWVLSEAIQSAPSPLAHVFISQSGFAALAGDEEASGWRYTGGFMRWNERFYLVEIQLIQNGAHMHGEHSIYVNGAQISCNRTSPMRYDEKLRFTVDVSPKNATNKAGEWSASSTGIKIEKIGDHVVDVTGLGGFIGKFYIYWTATDGSDVQAMLPFEYSPT